MKTDSKSDSTDKHPMHPATKITLIVVVVALVLSVGGFFGYQMFRDFRRHRMLDKARELFAEKDYGQAALSVRRALQVSPNDVEANRLMADLAEVSGVAEAIHWRREVATLQPDDENYLAMVKTAVQFRDLAAANEGLARVSEPGKLRSAYHEVAAQVAALSHKPDAIAAHIAEAARKDPQNVSFQVQSAVVNLSSLSPDVRQDAIATMEKFADDPAVRRPVLRTLMRDAAAGGEAERALRYAEKLRSAPEATFQDRMLYLDILRQLGRREFVWGIAQIFTEEPIDADKLTPVISYLNNVGLARLSLRMVEPFPVEVKTRMPIVVAIAEAHMRSGDWVGLKAVLKYGEWGELEFERLGLWAKVSREESDEPGARSRWEKAVVAAGGRPQAIKVLLGFTRAWKWEDEENRLLWVIARGTTDQRPALDLLLKRYSEQGNTSEMLRVFTRMLDLEPENAAIKNNVAYISLLLNVNPSRAAALAREAYQTDPSNAGFAGSYAFALHVLGKNLEGLKVIRALPPEQRREPSIALTEGLLLSNTGEKGGASEAFKLASAGQLLPQEQSLLTRAREKLGK